MSEITVTITGVHRDEGTVGPVLVHIEAWQILGRAS